ncbi:PAS domain-containing protein [Teichococcus aestuarii]|uniref:PAS domain-containing protein n=1 Tax=Teichococcus aestuarii TaxID=568898 RepID=UPI003619419F
MRDAVTERRRAVLETRDRLSALGREYERLFEVVMGSIEFSQPAAQREETRGSLLTLHRAITEIRLGLQDYMLSGEATQMRRVRSAIQQSRVYLRGAARLAAGDAALRDWIDQARQVGDAGGAILEALEQIDRLRQDGVVANRERLEKALDDAGAQVASASEEGRLRLEAAMENARHTMLILGLTAALLLLLLGLINARAIGTPLRRLAAAMAALAAGQTTAGVPGLGRRDEIGTIAQAMQALQATVGRAFAQSQMLEQLPLGVMTADPKDGFRITYLNEASREGLRPLQHALPCRVEELAGQSVDLFHPPAQRQRIRDILADPARLPYAAKIRLGDEVLALRVTAIRDAQGGYVGPMLSWSLITAQSRLAAGFEAEVGAVVNAVARSAGALQEAARGMSASATRSGQEAGAVAAEGSAPGPACRRWPPARSSSPPAWRR